MDFKEFFSNSVSKGDNLLLTLSDSRVLELNSKDYANMPLGDVFMVEGFLGCTYTETNELTLININQIIQITIINDEQDEFRSVVI